MTSNNSKINVQTKSNTANKLIRTHSVCSKFILGYKMYKIDLKRKIYQEASSFNTDRQIIIQPVKYNKLPKQGINNH